MANKKIYDVTGQKFNRLTAVSFVGRERHQTKWLFQCDCGNSHIAAASLVKSGKIKSCGCLKSETHARRTHGLSYERIYRTYNSMKRRCYEDIPRYAKHYKEKGITVCDEWRNDPAAFFKWAYANGYTDKMTIDRIDNDKGYYPENCRFITQSEQTRNLTRNVILKLNGEARILSEWSALFGFNHRMVNYWIKRGYSQQDALQKAIDNARASANAKTS